MKSRTRHLALIVAVVILVMVMVPAFAHAATVNYVALGDSISYGLTDLRPDATYGYVPYGYTRIYYDEYLTKLPGSNTYTYKNLSYPGYTSSSLLSVLGDQTNTATIRGGRIFTISIGSNNLLGPAIQSIIGLYGMNMGDYHDPNGMDMIRELARRVKADYDDGDAITPDFRFAQLMNPKSPAAIELNKNWLAGTVLFKLHWPVIMSRLRTKAPLAKVYVNNLYNPLTLSVLSSFGAYSSLYANLDLYMMQINATITNYRSLFRYRVIDVKTPFANTALYGSAQTAPLTFNIPGALMAASNPLFDPENDLSLMPFFFCCDPHPTTAGHYLIYQKLVAAQY